LAVFNNQLYDSKLKHVLIFVADIGN